MSFVSDGAEENMHVECNALNSWEFSIFNTV